MVKTVTFDAKDVFGKNFTIIDTFNNVQIVSKGLARVYKAIDEVDKKKGDDAVLLDYSNAIVPIILEEAGNLLGLSSKSETAKLKNLSYSVVQDFYADACKKFTGIDLPTIERMQENIKQAQAMANGQAGNGDEKLTDPK